MRLVIEAIPLIGRWSLSDVWHRNLATWPPSPDTLFSAFVAAAASVDWGEALPPEDVAASRYGQALTWLETLGPPEIEAAEDPPRVENMTWFVPTGDDAGIDQARERKARQHNSVGVGDAVRWAWRTNQDEAREWQPVLEEIAVYVTRIGSSRGPVLAVVKSVEDEAWRPTLVPFQAGSVPLRGVYPGRLTDLERWFRAGQRPHPGPTVSYAPPQNVGLEPIWGDILVLRKRDGLALDVRRSVDIAEAVRNALLAHLGDGASELLTGHAGDGGMLRRDHLAIVPMARLGDTHADGSVLGIAFVVPRNTSDAIWLELVSAVGRWIGSGGRLVIGGTTIWALELALADRRVSLNPDRWRRRATTWISATPVAFDRYPKPSSGRTLPEIVTSMCAKAGLPPPIRIRAGLNPMLPGALASRAYQLGTRNYLAGRYITHLEISWSGPVAGPILLGAGRHFGLGLLLPPASDRPHLAAPD